MKWLKKGLIYKAPFDGGWRHSSALTPTAIQLSNQIIRVYASFRDDLGVGRIGYVDVDARNPSRIHSISEKPVIELGQPGMFDDNGMILGDIVMVQKKIYMYYIGFQLVKNVKFLAYSGLAVSNHNGTKFNRFRETPILDRHKEGLFIRAIHSVLYEDGVFKVWYAVGNGWEKINEIDYPQYDINYIESKDGINFTKGQKIITNNKSNKEYRIGRPRVYKFRGKYVMNFTYGTIDGRYIAGQAMSNDGINWSRDDSQLGIETSLEGWDSKHLSYPCVLTTSNHKTFMFYNGNNMGADGFGYAELS
jgi:predicted GH43/DUF377 family glycosyl hydrolase